MASETEIRVQRKLTQALIDALPVSLALIPRTRTPDGSGGWTWMDETPRDPQVFHIVEFGGAGGADVEPLRTADGHQRYVTYTLLAAWDAEVGLYDRFTFNNEPCEIVELMRDNSWEIRAKIASWGDGDGAGP